MDDVFCSCFDDKLVSKTVKVQICLIHLSLDSILNEPL